MRGDDFVLRGDAGEVDGETGGELVEALVPFGPFVLAVRGEAAGGRAQNFIPDVLCLPEVQLDGQLDEVAGEGERAVEHLKGAGGHLQFDHGALHALVCDVAERGRFERDLVGFGESEEGTHLRDVNGIGLECAAEAGVDGEARGQGERRRLGQAGLREIVKQAGVILVDGGERVLDVPKGGVEDQLDDAALLVAEKRGEGVVDASILAIKQANDLREAGALHMLFRLRGEGLEGRGIGVGVGFYRSGNVLVAEVEHGKGEALLMAGNGAGDVGAAQRKAAAAGGVRCRTRCGGRR